MLYERPHSMAEIIEELYRDDILINKETLIKYFKTIRHSGCVLRKRQGKFSIESVPFSLDLTSFDCEYLAIFINLAVGLYADGVQNDLKSAMKKIFSLANTEAENKYLLYLERTKNIAPEPFIFKEKISTLLNYGYNNSKIRILYNEEKLVISHISFKYMDNSVYVHAFNEMSKSYELFLLGNIKEIYPTPEMSLQSVFAPYTVFELSGRLARTYTLYEGERVIKAKEDCIVVSNNLEDKQRLFRRLLRYGTLCKIISTQSDIENFKLMLSKIKQNLLNCEII